MTPIFSFLISSESKKKEQLRCVCLSHEKASHSHTMRTEVSSSVPHFLQVGLFLSPITYKCLLRVLCPVRRPITTLECVLLTIILRRSRTGTVWFYTSTGNKRAARPKLYTKSLIRDLELMYSRFTLVRISIKL